LHRFERDFSSLAGCYALLASLAAFFLIYAHVVFLSNSPDWWGLILSSFSSHAPRWRPWLDSFLAAACAFRERMHFTWFFLGVFAAVWLACLIWMQIERSRRHLGFNRQEAFWMGWMTFAVFVAAMLYGLGTNGMFPQRFPQIVTISDVVALGLMLALPVIVWSRLRHQQEEVVDESGETALPRRSSGFLGLNDDEVDARLAENLSLLEVRPEVRPVDLLPAVQIFHSDRPGEQVKAAADKLIESAESPVTAMPISTSLPAVAEPAFPQPVIVDEPVKATPSELAPAPAAHTSAEPASQGIDRFRIHLATLNNSWQNIETIRGEIDEWFEIRRQQAIAHLDKHPGLRTSTVAHDIFRDFPSDKLAAVDTEWAQIRTATLEITRWFEDTPAPDSGR